MSDKYKNGPLGAGDKFGDFIVVKLLGKGGMGFVYLVEAPETGLKYAAKIMLPPDSEEGGEWRKRFSREAEFAMKIHHRNLIRVHDVGEDPDSHLCYIIMEYIPGGTLSDRLRSMGKFAISDAVSIAAQVASALEVAHRAGVIHRDIKPGNILFDANGVPKIADLGIAKFSSLEETTTLTKTGAIIGTPAYMSPEQMIDSHHVDARTDIYSLGMVLYEMLTGIRPHADSTIVELLARAVNGKELPDIREMRPEVSAAVAYVLSRLVAPKPENRPNSALEAANLLRKAKEGNISVPKEYGCSKTVRLRRRKRLQVIYFAVASFLVGALLIGLGLVVGDYMTLWRGAEERRAKEQSRMDYLKKVRTYIGETRNSAEAFAKQFAVLFVDATNDCELAANKLGAILSETCPEDLIAKLKPGAVEGIEAVSFCGTSAEYVVEIVNDMRSLWKTADGINSIVRRVDKRLSELLSDIDATLKIQGEDEATQKRLSVMANGFRERYNDITGSRDVSDAMKSRGIIQSRSSRIVNTATKRIRQEKELSLRNQQKKDSRMAEIREEVQSLKQRLADAEADVALAKAAFDGAVASGAIKRFDWKGLKAALEDAHKEMKTPEGALQFDKECEKVVAIETSQDVLIRHAKGYTFQKSKLKGCTIQNVDDEGIVLAQKSMPISWPSLYRDYHGNINELFVKFVIGGRKQGLRRKEWFNAMIGTAYVISHVCSDDPSAVSYAEHLVREAVVDEVRLNIGSSDEDAVPAPLPITESDADLTALLVESAELAATIEEIGRTIRKTPFYYAMFPNIDFAALEQAAMGKYGD